MQNRILDVPSPFFIRLAAITGLLSSLTSAPARAETRPEFLSRSMPDHCEFVYRMDTDFKLRFPLPVDAATLRASELVYGLEDSYGKLGDWVREGHQPVDVSAGDARAAFRLETMSTAEHRLERVMNFYFLYTDAVSGQVTRDPVDPTVFYHVNFSRHFGDPCYYDGAQSTPFYVRQIEQKVMSPRP